MHVKLAVLQTADDRQVYLAEYTMNIRLID